MERKPSNSNRQHICGIQLIVKIHLPEISFERTEFLFESWSPLVIQRRTFVVIQINLARKPSVGHATRHGDAPKNIYET